MITLDNCLIEMDKQAIYRVVNPDQCPDKQLVAYLNDWDKIGPDKFEVRK